MNSLKSKLRDEFLKFLKLLKIFINNLFLNIDLESGDKKKNKIKLLKINR